MLAPRPAHPLPHYLRIERDLRRRLSRGEFRERSFPTDRELCERYDVGRLTVQHALRGLAADGLIERRRGRRTEVLPQTQALLRRQPGRYILGIDTDLRSQGIALRARLVGVADVAADERVAAALQLPLGSPCTKIRRVGTRQLEPVVLNDHFCSVELGARLRERDLNGDLLSSLVNAISGPIVEVQLQVTAEGASADDAEQLGVGTGEAVLVSAYTMFDARNRPLSFQLLRYRADRVELDFTFDVRQPR